MSAGRAPRQFGEERGGFAVKGVQRKGGPHVLLGLRQPATVALEAGSRNQALAMLRMSREHGERLSFTSCSS